VTAAAVVSGIFLLHDGYVLRKNNSGVARARLAALDIARPSLSPQQEVPLEVYTQVPAGSYYSAVDAFGSPGYTESQLARSSDEKRVAADVMFESVLGIRLTPSTSRGSGPQGHCRIASPTGRGPGLSLGPGAYDLMDRSASGASLRLSRFGSVPFGTLGTLSPREWHSLVIPPDRSARRWYLTVVGSGPVRVCSARPS
jgi:hypothetical protein